MKDNWSEQKFASDWDKDSAVSNPSRSRLLDLLTTIIADSATDQCNILDLGFGSGHVEKQILAKVPHAKIVGVDASDTMIALAKEKLKDNPDVKMIQHDLNDIQTLALPDKNYNFAITSFVLHEITAEHKQNIFEFIYKNLASGGMYILVDRFKVDIESLPAAYKSQWAWQTKDAYWTDWKEEFSKYLDKVNSKEDSPDFVEDQLKWLRAIGFKAACLQLEFDRGLIVGVKS